jgi:hypothetical protein
MKRDYCNWQLKQAMKFGESVENLVLSLILVVLVVVFVGFFYI